MVISQVVRQLLKWLLCMQAIGQEDRYSTLTYWLGKYTSKPNNPKWYSAI